MRSIPAYGNAIGSVGDFALDLGEAPPPTPQDLLISELSLQLLRNCCVIERLLQNCRIRNGEQYDGFDAGRCLSIGEEFLEQVTNTSNSLAVRTGQRPEYAAEQSILLSSWREFVVAGRLEICLADNWPSEGEVINELIEDVAIAAAKEGLNVDLKLTFQDLDDDFNMAVRLSVGKYARNWLGEASEDSNCSQRSRLYRIASREANTAIIGPLFWGPPTDHLRTRAEAFVRSQEAAARSLYGLESRLAVPGIRVSVALGNPTAPALVVGNSPMLVGQFNHQVGSANAPCSYVERGGPDFDARLFEVMEPHYRGPFTKRVPLLPEDWRYDKLIRVLSLVHDAQEFDNWRQWQSTWPKYENTAP